MNFFICGTHCCGKTSIIDRLKDEGIIQFSGDEIGKRLYYEQKFSTAKQDPNFELILAKMELKRDKLIAKFKSSKLAALETWHPGNVAYALERNPETAKNLIDTYQKSPIKGNTKGIWLYMDNPEKTIKERTITFKDNPIWAASFYSKIQSNIKESLEMMGLLKGCIKINVDQPFEYVYKQVRSVILESNSNLLFENCADSATFKKYPGKLSQNLTE